MVQYFVLDLFAVSVLEFMTSDYSSLVLSPGRGERCIISDKSDVLSPASSTVTEAAGR
ncbi:hypothetical protein RRG08_000318 [Elysia crispata]|uniref:Uncharacterized protein n=1 Tax=Elysia crispata TaxID=231223 RepID=A0AAE1BCJ2_9GAST|nr:hypothetical protein RRG08_000318 [Elysia crispata]